MLLATPLLSCDPILRYYAKPIFSYLNLCLTRTHSLIGGFLETLEQLYCLERQFMNDFAATSDGNIGRYH